MRIAQRIGLSLSLAALASAPVAPIAAQTVSATPASTIQLATSSGRLVTLPVPMADAFTANPAVADVQVRSPTQLYVIAKGPGETNVFAVTKAGKVAYSTTVRVGNNYDSLAKLLRLAMPEADITPTMMNGLVLLTGTVGNPDDVAEAERLTKAFVGDTIQVVSRLKTAVPLQVNLQVKFVEVSRSFIKNIGLNLLTRDTSGGFLFGIQSGRTPGTITDAPGGGTAYTFTKAPEGTRGTIGMAGHLLGLDVLSAIDIGEQTGQVTTLASPNLTALSGETGTFLAGGEIPIPLAQALGTTSVEYKQYGVSLAYTPTVLSDGRISLRVRPEVSQLSNAGAVQISGTTIPALTTRRAETTVELGSGQSFMIAGLLSNSHDNSVDKIPGLGDIPILGQLFRSNNFKRNETELVIVITPYLVKPINARDVRLPSDNYRAPDDAERTLLGKLSGQTSLDRPKPSVAVPDDAAPSVGAVSSAPVTPSATIRQQMIAPPKPKKGAAPAPGFSGN